MQDLESRALRTYVRELDRSPAPWLEELINLRNVATFLHLREIGVLR